MQTTSYGQPAPQVQTIMYGNQQQNVPANQFVMMQPAAVVAPNPSNFQNEMFKSKFKSLGIAQLSIGISCLICGIAVAVLTAGSNGSGIWGGIWFIITGVMGIVSAANPYKRYVIAGFVLGVISVILSVVVVIIDSIDASSYGNLVSGTLSYSTLNILVGVNYYAAAIPYILLAVNVILAILAFSNMIVAIRYCLYCYKSGFGQVFEEPRNSSMVGTVPVATVSAPAKEIPQAYHASL